MCVLNQHHFLNTHLGLDSPLRLHPLLPLLGERQSPLRELLVVVVVSTVDDDVVRCLGIVHVPYIRHPLLVRLSSTVDIWRGRRSRTLLYLLFTYPEISFRVVWQKMAGLVPVVLDLPLTVN